MEQERTFLLNIVKEIVDNPNDVEIAQETDKMGVKLTLKVNPADMSKVIGNKGRMATALRTITHAYGGRHESKIGLIIEEPEGSTFNRDERR